MSAIGDLRACFARATAAGDEAAIAPGALVIARIGHPELAPEPSLAALDALAEGIRPRLLAGDPPERRAAVLARYLFEEQGFRGNRDDYYDPRNSFLNDVLERRTGIPITLAVVMIEVGARVGVRLEGVGFPGHFLVRVSGCHDDHLLDPFFGGRPVAYDELRERLRAFYAASGAPSDGNLQRALPQALRSAGTSGILSRTLANLLAIYRERDAHDQALATVELLLLLWPDAPEYVRLRGLLYEQLECFASALADFRRYLALAPDAPTAAAIRIHLERLEQVTDTTLH
ncbi:MAG: tetratricopeptide repeat protein [Deltaproteobacteria bacterium]|nr:tetratricopeptide repeat protein [Deltaproteobacteria bacterium]